MYDTEERGSTVMLLEVVVVEEPSREEWSEIDGCAEVFQIFFKVLFYPAA